MNGETILVVDDNQEIVYSISELLKYEGYQVVKAYDGMKALNALEINNIDLILLDVMMPVMDGLEAARRIRSLKREDAKTVPIFAMSANTFIDDIAKSREAGMDEHFTKPLDIEVIREAIGRYCGRGRVF